MADYYVATDGDDSTGDGSVGNPFASPGKASGVATSAGDNIWVKSGTYTLTTSTANVSGGKVELTSGVKMEGYLTTAGDRAARPVLSAGAFGSITLFRANSPYSVKTRLTNLEADGNGNSSVHGFILYGTTSGQPSTFAYGCLARDCPGYGFYEGHTHLCTALNCGTGFYRPTTAGLCWCDNAASNSFTHDDDALRSFWGCLATNGGGIGFYVGFVAHVYGCTAHGNDGDGFRCRYDNVTFGNCIATNNGGYGFNCTNSNRPTMIWNCASRGNVSGHYHTADVFHTENLIELSTDPYVDAASLDFTLNDAAGGGAAVKGLEETIIGSSMTTTFDLGLLQSGGSGGGGGGGRRRRLITVS